MRLLPLLLMTPMTLLFCSPQARAFDTSTQNMVASGYVTSKVTSAPFDHKLIIAAQDDAAAFIASDGAIRGAQLESALLSLRQAQLTCAPAKLHASDLELAQAILVQ
jgi:uncharacterized protein (TIGR02448 family)